MKIQFKTYVIFNKGKESQNSCYIQLAFGVLSKQSASEVKNISSSFDN